MLHFQTCVSTGRREYRNTNRYRRPSDLNSNLSGKETKLPLERMQIFFERLPNGLQVTEFRSKTLFCTQLML